MNELSIRRKEMRTVRAARVLGFQAAPGDLRSTPSVAILAPEDRLDEARALLRSPTEMASWRTPEIWRLRFAAAGITVPGQAAKVWALFGAPA